MFQDTKEQLHRSFDSIAPDLLSNILSADIQPVATEEELFSEMGAYNPSSRHTSYRFHRYASVAAVFICVIMLFFFQTQSVEGTVTVEGNYSTVLSFDHSGKIVRIKSNDKSKKMAELCKNLKGKRLEEGLRTVLKTSSHSKKTICVIYEGKKKTDKNRKAIRDVTKRFSKDSGTNVVSKEQSVGHSKEEVVDVAENKESSKNETVDTTENMDSSREEVIHDVTAADEKDSTSDETNSDKIAITLETGLDGSLESEEESLEEAGILEEEEAALQEDCTEEDISEPQEEEVESQEEASCQENDTFDQKETIETEDQNTFEEDSDSSEKISMDCEDTIVNTETEE